jgi:hypothetical protein
VLPTVHPGGKFPMRQTRALSTRSTAKSLEMIVLGKPALRIVRRSKRETTDP